MAYPKGILKALSLTLLTSVPFIGLAQAQQPGQPEKIIGLPSDAPKASYKPSWFWWPSRTVPRGQPYVPLTRKERVDLLLRGSFLNPGSWGRASFAASIDQWQNDPPQWGSNTDGFEKRLLDRYANFAVRDSIEAVWAGAIGHEVRYISSTRPGFGPRLWHAFIGGFRTYNTEGRWRPNYARVGSTFGAAYIRYTWQPHRERDPSELAYETALQLVVNSSSRIYREFSPEINNVLFGWARKKDKYVTPLPTSLPAPSPTSDSKQ